MLDLLLAARRSPLTPRAPDGAQAKSELFRPAKTYRAGAPDDRAKLSLLVPFLGLGKIIANTPKSASNRRCKKAGANPGEHLFPYLALALMGHLGVLGARNSPKRPP